MYAACTTAAAIRMGIMVLTRAAVTSAYDGLWPAQQCPGIDGGQTAIAGEPCTMMATRVE